MRSLSLLSRDCFTWLRLTIQSLLARKNMELSSRRSQSARERRMRTLPLGKWPIVKFRWASRREMSSTRTNTFDSFWTATTNGMYSTIRANQSPR